MTQFSNGRLTNRQGVVTKRTESGYTATSQATRVRISRDFSMNEDDNHREAARKLIDKMDWGRYGVWHGGYLPDGCSMAWVCVHKEDR